MLELIEIMFMFLEFILIEYFCTLIKNIYIYFSNKTIILYILVIYYDYLY